jgi:RHH-type proline utilization regulon transcriptional repressor/proline dehydrogenase/delta 1-pyrroline-5-carboxylate dehydrogenase
VELSAGHLHRPGGAALAAGNVVLAKPAEQTPLIAAEACALHAAGVPRDALQLLPGDGERRRGLVADRVRGRDVHRLDRGGAPAQAQLAERLTPEGQPIAADRRDRRPERDDRRLLRAGRTGGAGRHASAFDSAGQRCSALRVLCLQDDVAERTLAMLKGAMAEASVGNPERLATDIGPVIDAEAQRGIQRHIDAMRARGRRAPDPRAGWPEAERRTALRAADADRDRQPGPSCSARCSAPCCTCCAIPAPGWTR